MNMIHRVNVEFPDVYILVRLYRNFSRPWDEFHQSIQPAISSIQENIDNYLGNIVVLLNDDNRHGFPPPDPFDTGSISFVLVQPPKQAAATITHPAK